MRNAGKEGTFLSLVIQHNTEILKAPSSPLVSHKSLLYGEDEFEGHREDALQSFNCPVDEMRALEANEYPFRYGR